MIGESIKLYKDNIFNRTFVVKINEEEDSKYNKENYKYLGSIIKEKDKYYFNPLLIDLGNDKDNINDVSWLIYNKKTEPEINHSYIVKEGDMVTTTGLTDYFPSGILIGKVSKVVKDEYDLNSIVEVKPTVDFENISVVTVLNRKAIEE